MDVQAVVNLIRIARETLEKGGWYVYTYSNFIVSGHESLEFTVILRPPYDSSYEWKSDDNITIRERCSSADDLGACADRFLTSVNMHPTLIEFVQGRFRQRLVDMAEEGEMLGFALEYVEVLRATSKALATNALAAPREHHA